MEFSEILDFLFFELLFSLVFKNSFVTLWLKIKSSCNDNYNII